MRLDALAVLALLTNAEEVRSLADPEASLRLALLDVELAIDRLGLRLPLALADAERVAAGLGEYDV